MRANHQGQITKCQCSFYRILFSNQMTSLQLIQSCNIWNKRKSAGGVILIQESLMKHLTWGRVSGYAWSRLSAESQETGLYYWIAAGGFTDHLYLSLKLLNTHSCWIPKPLIQECYWFRQWLSSQISSHFPKYTVIKLWDCFWLLI